MCFFDVFLSVSFGRTLICERRRNVSLSTGNVFQVWCSKLRALCLVGYACTSRWNIQITFWCILKSTCPALNCFCKRSTQDYKNKNKLRYVLKASKICQTLNTLGFSRDYFLNILNWSGFQLSEFLFAFASFLF